MTPLHLAVKHHNVRAVEALISHGASIQAKDAHQNTPLHYAAKAGYLKICEVSKVDIFFAELNSLLYLQMFSLDISSNESTKYRF